MDFTADSLRAAGDDAAERRDSLAKQLDKAKKEYKDSKTEFPADIELQFVLHIQLCDLFSRHSLATAADLEAWIEAL